METPLVPPSGHPATFLDVVGHPAPFRPRQRVVRPDADAGRTTRRRPAPRAPAAGRRLGRRLCQPADGARRPTGPHPDGRRQLRPPARARPRSLRPASPPSSAVSFDGRPSRGPAHGRAAAPVDPRRRPHPGPGRRPRRARAARSTGSRSSSSAARSGPACSTAPSRPSWSTSAIGATSPSATWSGNASWTGPRGSGGRGRHPVPGDRLRGAHAGRLRRRRPGARTRRCHHDRRAGGHRRARRSWCRGPAPPRTTRRTTPRWLSSRHGAVLLPERELSAARLADELDRLARRPGRAWPRWRPRPAPHGELHRSGRLTALIEEVAAR